MPVEALFPSPRRTSLAKDVDITCKVRDGSDLRGEYHDVGQQATVGDDSFMPFQKKNLCFETGDPSSFSALLRDNASREDSCALERRLLP